MNMHTASASQTVRIDARIPSFLKESLVYAASLQGRSQTDFLISALTEATQKAITDHEYIQLHLEDQKNLAAAILDTDRAPVPRLQRAAQEYARYAHSDAIETA